LQNSISNTAQLPGGNLIITVFRWLLISSLLLYALPILIYLIIYRTKNVLGDLILGIFSSIFYSPAYLIILNIFSLCRIDDITWGTKGLNNEAESKSSHLTRSWKSLKYIQVWKFIFWNMVVGVLIVSFGDSYTPRFFISFILLIILLFTMVVKIIIGLIYLIHYACTKRIEKPSEYHIVSSVVLDNLSVLRNDILQEV
jgi:chitin synthase